MAEWTNSARVELENYFTRVRASLAGSGADSAEVIDDLKRHIDAEIAATKLNVVTEEDIRRILSRIGEPSIPKDVSAAQRPQLSLLEKVTRKTMSGLLFFFAVILPAITLSIELATRMCASTFFDPMPSFWHVLIVAFVPATNFATWWAVRRNKTEWRNKLALANVFAIVISFYYALMFFPLMLPGVIAIMIFGWGLLPLSPFFSFLATLRLRTHLKRLEPEVQRLPGWGWGLAGSAVLLAVIALPLPATRYFERLAASDSPATAAQGVKWLRAIGDRETLLMDCYGSTRWRGEVPFGFAMSGQPVSPEEARSIYFRVTGKPFNSQPPPHVKHHSRDWAMLDDIEWDEGLGGDEVAGVVKGLSLHSSRVDAAVEPDAALAYYEWTMEFKNVADVQREARAQILLPHGAVVSRLTLWINGEEREAAFGGRSQVKTAYQQVAVQQRRDPVLVTTCGPDRVLMQCFPVPARGGVMKLRIGMTVPMHLRSIENGAISWPVFLERNFKFPEGFKHSVWVESNEPLSSNLQALKSGKPRTGLFALHGDLTDIQLSDPRATVTTHRSGQVDTVWAACEENGRVVRQTIKAIEEPAPGRLVLVVDGSESMNEFADDVADLLKEIPANLEFALVMASDGEHELWNDVWKRDKAFYEKISKKMSRFSFVGGQDNVPALLRGWDMASETTNSLVLWVHGPQPVLLSSADGLRQRFERHPGSPKLYEIQTRPGPNRIAEKLDGIDAVISIPRLGGLKEDLLRVLGTLNGNSRVFGFVRELVDQSTLGSTIKEASKHVSRLWAFGRVTELAAGRKANEAMSLASRMQLVTSVSGAVVLETMAQYEQNGLKPADPTTVPVVPEPGTWALLALGLAVILGGKYLKRRGQATIPAGRTE